VDHVHESGEKFRYHIWTEAKSAQLAWYNLGVEIELLAIAGGTDGEGSSYTKEGVGGLAGEWAYKTEIPIAPDYQIFSVHPGGPGEKTTLSIPGVDERELEPGVGGIKLGLDKNWQEVLGYATVGGSVGDGVGPVNADEPGEGGGGGFRLKEPYDQQSYIHKWTTGGPYDCSYGAGCRDVPNGTKEHIGDTQPCNGCPPPPPGWGGTECHGPCDCMTYPNAAGGWFSRGLAGCPGGWYGCHGCKCCTQVPDTKRVCDQCNSGGSWDGGSTCRKTCDNTQHHQETRWTPCNDGYTSVNRVCTDSRPAGGGKGAGGIVAIRYKFDPDTYVVPEAGTGVPIMY
jgi:hypothetical protein